MGRERGKKRWAEGEKGSLTPHSLAPHLICPCYQFPVSLWRFFVSFTHCFSVNLVISRPFFDNHRFFSCTRSLFPALSISWYLPFQVLELNVPLWLVLAMDGYSSDMNIHQGFLPSKRYARIETQDFPEKFCIMSRLKKESFVVGSRGEILKCSAHPEVQVKVPEGAVSNGTKITLQVSAKESLLLFNITVHEVRLKHDKLFEIL